MVYVTNWVEFSRQAEELYEQSPKTTRWVVKYKAPEGRGKLVLKITDDTKKCIKYKTYSTIYLNRFEALNLSLMRRMQNAHAPTALETPNPGTPEPSRMATPVPQATPGSSGVAAGGAAKKKKGKKKK